MTGKPAIKPSVLFVCVHNAGRSQMAAGWLRHLADDTIDVRSTGSEPADRINAVAVEAMREVGIDITTNTPRKLDYATAEASDVLVSMGCGDACPSFLASATSTGTSTTPPAKTSTPPVSDPQITANSSV